jgi:hypothetical protein
MYPLSPTSIHPPTRRELVPSPFGGGYIDRIHGIRVFGDMVYT